MTTGTPVMNPADDTRKPHAGTLTTQRQNVIVTAANDPNALVPYLKRAMAQGVKVVTFDSDTAPEGRPPRSMRRTSISSTSEPGPRPARR